MGAGSLLSFRGRCLLVVLVLVVVLSRGYLLWPGALPLFPGADDPPLDVSSFFA